MTRRERKRLRYEQNPAIRFSWMTPLDKENIMIRDKSGSNSIQIDSVQNAITIESSAKLSLKAKDMELASDGRLSIKANGRSIDTGRHCEDKLN